MSDSKLYRVSASLTPAEFKVDVQEWDAIEKKLTYFVSKKDQWGELLERRVRKDQIDKIEEGRWRIGLETVQYQAWCHEKDIEEWKDACTRVVVKTVRRFQVQLDALLVHLPKS